MPQEEEMRPMGDLEDTSSTERPSDETETEDGDRDFYDDDELFYDDDDDLMFDEGDDNILIPKSRWQRIKHRVWRFLDDPSSSWTAFIWSIFIMILIIVSVVVFMVETLPYFTKNPEPAFFYIELVIVVIFTIEYIARFVTCPTGPLVRPWIKDKFRFIRQPLNIIDFLAVAPFYLELVFTGTPGLGWIRVIRLTRVFRVLKLGRYQEGFLLFYKTFTSSVEVLILAIIFIIVGMILFSSFLFYAEQTMAHFDDDEELWYYNDDTWTLQGAETKFQSIPETFWWCIVTMTTVGYGDTFPVTPLGRLVASITFLSALCIIAFPIAILGNSFLEFYIASEERKRKRRRQRWLHKRGSKRQNHLVPPVRSIANSIDAANEAFGEIQGLIRSIERVKDDVGKAVELFNAKDNLVLVNMEFPDGTRAKTRWD